VKIQLLKNSIVLVALLNVVFAFSQQDAQWSHYQFNQHYYNPGYVGLEQLSRATLLHRTQWLGYQTTIVEDREGGAPSQQEISLVQPLKIKSKVVNSGVGLLFNNDKLGPMLNQDLKIDFSYHYKPRIGGTFGFGLRAGFRSQAINAALLRATDKDDVIIDQFGTGRIKQTKPDLGFGIFYNSTKFYVSTSLSHLVRSEYNYNVQKDSIESLLSRNLWLSAGYNIFFSQLVITPAVHYKADFNHSSYNLGVLAQLNKYKYWAGVNFRQSFVNQSADNGGGKQVISDDVVFLIGTSFLKNNSLRVGYAFDLVTSGIGAKSNTSHEIMLSYAIPLFLESKKTPISDPRYRHE
jgi:type IX secretion system PorP/SprF family membrane protein